MSSEKIECFSKDETYSRFVLGLDLEKLKELESIDQKKTIFALVSLYFMTAVLVFVSMQLTNINYFFYIPCIFLITGTTNGIGKSITNALLSKKSSSYSRLIGDNKNPVLIFVQ